MSVDDIKKYILKKTKKIAVSVATMVTVATGHAASQNLTEKNTDSKQDKTELKANWGDKDHKVIEHNDSSFIIINDDQKVCITMSNAHKNTEQRLEKDFDKIIEESKQEKELYQKQQAEDFAHAPENTERQVELDLDNLCLGRYNPISKNIIMSDLSEAMSDSAKMADCRKEYFSNGENDSVKWQKFKETYQKFNESNVQHSVSIIYSATQTHENQHRLNDQNNILAPGISVKDMVVVAKYDEIVANIAELNFYISTYKKALKQGYTREEALKIFDNEHKFDFYADALRKGMDVNSEQSKKMMVWGTINMWENYFEKSYAHQLSRNSTFLNEGRYIRYLSLFNSKNETLQKQNATISLEDFTKMFSDNPDEVQNRVKIMLDNIPNAPQGLSEYMPKKLDISAFTRLKVMRHMQNLTGLTLKELNQFMSSNQKKNTDKNQYESKVKEIVAKLRKGITQQDSKSNTLSSAQNPEKQQESILKYGHGRD